MQDIIRIEIAETDSDFKNLSKMAEIIWKEHYTPIIGKDQVKYMVENFQSCQSIKKQVQNGTNYYFIKFNKDNAGYIAIDIEENQIFLSKIYLFSKFRHKGIGKEAIKFIDNLSKSKNINKIYLHVNKNNNHSIEAYKKYGFKISEDKISDIGSGFVMDDYIMVKKV